MRTFPELFTFMRSCLKILATRSKNIGLRIRAWGLSRDAIAFLARRMVKEDRVSHQHSKASPPRRSEIKLYPGIVSNIFFMFEAEQITSKQ